MLTVLVLTVLLSVLAVALIDVMSGEASRSRTAVKRDAAYQAAEAGVDDYISKLIDDRLYYFHFVHPGEATRLASTSGRLVGAAQTWLQTDGSSWAYSRGKDAWYGSPKLGNGHEYDLEIVPPSAAQPPIRIPSTPPPVGAPDVRHRGEPRVPARGAGVRGPGGPAGRRPDGRRRLRPRVPQLRWHQRLQLS